MVFSRYVEPGRVAVINYGDENGKIGVIVDILDERRVLFDGPTTGVTRAVYPLKRLSLTDIKLDLGKGARTGSVRKAAEKENLEDQWNKTSWAKKIASRARRAELTDFERFKVMVLRRQRTARLNKVLKGGKKK